MNVPLRVQYRERQRLRAGDLQAEQDYLLGLAGRHNLGPHEWGIVRGLRIVVENGVTTLTPGLAVDGYGRELVVSQEVELTLLANVREQFVYLNYCERPQGSCGDRPNPRWGGAAEITISDKRWPIPEGEPDLLIARAAGKLTDYPPWPILLGVLENGAPATTDKDFKFTRLLAARVTSPSVRAVMRIGQENLADPYHFRVSAHDAKGLLQNRFAIDQDGNPILWGNLVLQGNNYSATIATQRAGLFIRVESPEADGENITWRAIAATNSLGQPTLKIIFRRIGDPTPIAQQLIRLDNDRSLRMSLLNFNGRPIPIRMFRAALVTPDASPPKSTTVAAVSNEATSGAAAANEAISTQAAATAQISSALVDDRELPLERSGGLLRFSPEAEDDPAGPCGCRERDKSEPRLPQGIIFRPVSEPPTVPNSRDIYDLRLTTQSGTAIDEIRLSGGLFSKGDLKSRISLGGSKDPAPFSPWLVLRGNGSIELRGGKIKDGKAFEMIRVLGTAEYPPVKPDPLDPLFNSLIALAFINGVLALSSSLIKVTITEFPEFIERGQPNWEYELSVQNLGLTEPLLPDRSTERISSGTQSFIKQNLNIPLKIDPQTTRPITISRLPADVPPGDKVIIEVSVSMKAGSTTVGGFAKTGEIPVYESPSIDPNLPASIPSGAAFDFDVDVINGPSKELNLLTVQVDGLGAPIPLQPVSNPLAPSASTLMTSSVTIPAPNAGDPDLNITVTITYRWQGATATSSLSITKTVAIT
ncbi:MAG: hypothetical protein AABN95_03495 [Acidobacteriota bacterium]